MSRIVNNLGDEVAATNLRDLARMCYFYASMDNGYYMLGSWRVLFVHTEQRYHGAVVVVHVDRDECTEQFTVPEDRAGEFSVRYVLREDTPEEAKHAISEKEDEPYSRPQTTKPVTVEVNPTDQPKQKDKPMSKTKTTTVVSDNLPATIESINQHFAAREEYLHDFRAKVYAAATHNLNTVAQAIADDKVTTMKDELIKLRLEKQLAKREAAVALAEVEHEHKVAYDEMCAEKDMFQRAYEEQVSKTNELRFRLDGLSKRPFVRGSQLKAILERITW